MSDFRYVRYAVEDRIATLLWNRPEARNAMLPEMNDEAGEALKLAAADPEVRALVLSGAGDAFSAGADLKLMGRGDREEYFVVEGGAPAGPSVRGWFERLAERPFEVRTYAPSAGTNAR